jgi:hypothetical protein
MNNACLMLLCDEVESCYAIFAILKLQENIGAVFLVVSSESLVLKLCVMSK